MNRWYTNSSVLTIPVACIAAAYVWYVFLPNRHTITQDRAEIQQKVAFVANSEKVAADIARTERDMQATDAYIHQWDNVSADPVQIAGVFKSIAEVAKQSGVQTTRFVSEPVVKMASMERIPLRLGCRGDLESIFRLLASLERLNQRLWIEELTLEPGNEDGEVVQCGLVVAFFANNPEKSI